MANDMLTTLVNQFGGAILEQIGAKLGIPPATVKKFAPIAISLVMGSMARSAKKPDGMQAVQGLLGMVSSNKALAAGDMTSFLSDFDVTKSADMLKLLAGGNSVKNVVGNVAANTGVSSKAASGMLSALAPMALAGMSKMATDKGLDTKGLVNLVATESKGLSGVADIDKMLDYTPGLVDQVTRALKGLFGG